MISKVDCTLKLLNDTLEEAWQSVLKYDNDAAMAHARTAATIAPDSPDVAHLLGILASRDGRSDIALPLLQKALDAKVTERRLRDMTEALMIASQPQAALAPITDAIKYFGESSANLGMLAAVQIALEDYDSGAKSAQKAVSLSADRVLWEGSLAFCDLILQKFNEGLKALTARPSNLVNGARCPALYHCPPTDLWLKNEQGPGDTVFFLCHAQKLKAMGWRLHVQSHLATLGLLKNSGLFSSVSLSLDCPADSLWINIGDLPLAAMQLGLAPLQAPLAFEPDGKLVDKIQKIIAKFGPPPYVAVTWRGGVQGKKQRAGVRMGDRYIDSFQLGKTLANFDATIISIQRVPDRKEENAFKHGLGRPFLDLSRLNNNLPEMLALLSLVDEYVAVPNTNHHLRESLGLSSQIVVNRPFEDWRWGNAGNAPWYPKATVYRQELNGSLDFVFGEISKALSKRLKLTNVGAEKLRKISGNNSANLLAKGWQAVSNNNIPLAIQTAQSILAENPDNADALHLLGWAAMRDLKLDIAVSVLSRATELAPLEGRIIGDFIRALTANNQFDKAIEVATIALNNHEVKNLSGIYYGRAATYLKLNRLPEAIADYETCIHENPNRLDAPEYCGMARLKLGDARQGFRDYTARKVASRDELLNDWCCPRLKPEHKGSRVLIKRDMGLGDELTYLRYLPWLTDAGVTVDYWAGKKLVPVLERMGYLNQVFSDASPAPDREIYDISFIVNDLPVAVEMLNAPPIAPPLPLTPRKDLIEKWKQWLESLGDGPYIGFNWRAGAAAEGVAAINSKLAKAIDKAQFSQTLAPVKATWVSLQRNIMMDDLQQFEKLLNAPVYDAAALTDDLEDLLALLSLLDENIGVSNTNMHLRASLGKSSKVLVQNPGSDWRWGFEGNRSLWFTDSIVYRQEINGEWKDALYRLQTDLLEQYGRKAADVEQKHQLQTSAESKRVIWLSAGIIKHDGVSQTSDLASTRYRVIAPARQLEEMGWHNEFVNEELAAATGGWGSSVPKAGDKVIISKVFTDHAIKMAKDSKARGAQLVVDFCDNFLLHPKRGPLQNALLELADSVVASSEAMATALAKAGKHADVVITDPVEMSKGKIVFSPKDTLKLLWFGHAVNIDTLVEFLPQLAEYAKSQKLELNVVTTLSNGSADLAKITPQGLSVRYTAWSVDATSKAINDCDIVLIPTLSNEIKKAKSPNRLLEPLWSGRFVVAGSLPAYQAFAEYAWVDSNLIEGIAWALANPKEVVTRIGKAQAEIEKNYSADTIAQSWHTVLSKEQFPLQNTNVNSRQIDANLISAQHSQEEIKPEQWLLSNGWFDGSWYKQQYGLNSESEVVTHFISAADMIDPSTIFQPKEAVRLLNLATAKPFEVLKTFTEKYPPLATYAAPKTIAVFTAIFGGYDVPPVVEHPDPALDYILFTDDADIHVPAPWQLRVLPRIFDDPQVDARRVKVLSHLFLPDYQASVWIDGNVVLKTLSADYVNRVLSHAPIAVCRHQFRNCIYDEAMQIVKTAKDAPAPVMKQMRYFQSLAYPKGYGLHATMFMIRDHRNNQVQKHNARWWEVLSEHSKRDQLSFDFVRWELTSPVLSMPINCRDNALFQWGADATRGHKGQVRRNDESVGRAFNTESLNSSCRHLPTYKASYDRWPRNFLLQLFDLNVNLEQANSPFEESIIYLQGNHKTPLSIPDPRKGQQQELYLAAIAESQNIIFVGGDSGHNVLLALNFSGANCTLAYEHGTPLNQISSSWFRNVHKNRFNSIAGTFDELDEDCLKTFDTIVLDHAKDSFNSRLNTIISKINIGTRIIVLGKSYISKQDIPEYGYMDALAPFRGLISHDFHAFILEKNINKTNSGLNKMPDYEGFTLSVYDVWLKSRIGDLTWKFAINGKYGFFYSDWLKKQGKCVFLDIGANIGLYSLIANQNPNIKNIHSFEPHPDTFNFLVKNIDKNNADRCHLHPYAISNITANQDIYSKSSHSGVATLRQVSDAEGFTEKVQIQSIDASYLDHLIKIDSDYPVVIKIDVEGYEKVVIETLMQCQFWQNVINIYYEVDENYLDHKSVSAILDNQGFKVVHKNGDGSHYDLMVERQFKKLNGGN